MQQPFAFSALYCLLHLSSTLALWIPEELKNDAAFWVAEDFIPLKRRDDTCGGIAGLDPCSGDFPSSFCCSTNSKCLALNTTSNIQAALCCPAGQDCQAINPISCDSGMQNATTNPSSQLHSEPTTSLETCGSSCCPMGYTCQGNYCIALAAEEVVSSSTRAAISLLPTATPISTSPDSSTTSGSGVSITSVPLVEPIQDSSSQSFNGKSFAAGFIPGIVIGAFLAAGLIIFMLRRERRKSPAYKNEKHYSSGRDTLTDLGPEMIRRPTVHGRSISEPTVDTSLGHRTDFLNSTPPRDAEHQGQGSMSGYIVNVNSPPRAADMPTGQEEKPSRTKAWLSRSPFVNQVRTPVPTQSPVPAHLKRGTLSFHISPIRALKKQKSMHSLRRQMTDLSTRSNSTTRRNRPEHSRSDSTETIKVLMATPDQTFRPQQASTLPSSSYRPPRAQPPASATGTWETTTGSSSDDSEDSTPIEPEPNTYTPTRPGRNSNIEKVGATLNSPYTPSNYPRSNNNNVDTKKSLNTLMPPEIDAQNSRDSTFSAIMEKVGLRKTLLMGPGTKKWDQR